MQVCWVLELDLIQKENGEIVVKGIDKKKDNQVYEIIDTREGWVESLKLLLESYFHGRAPLEFDYSLIRPEGEPISGFGGVASGHKPLEEVHESEKCLKRIQENPPQ